ncbi:ribosomal protein L17 [Metschnikowia bicuspidata]|uniref:Ribosomal protein L17 n=1 Tax=Metschnikowia bicuspidata TaxID=27322 RepID=A0A4P9ZD13_9ASCO|nr:ribosomal protein L17 [Metschnikowia bicuspidata]
MPNLKNFKYDRARHFRMMDRNLCANLIRHEHIITGRAKAKRAQAKIEQFLGKALHQNRQLVDKPLKERLSSVRALEFLQVPDRQECGTKVLEDLSQRFLNRTHGFTRIIKLERRLADDKAEMSCLELVDSDLEVKFWYTAKIVARLELQNLPIDELTTLNVRKLTQLRVNGEERFRAAVEEAKEVFFAEDKRSTWGTYLHNKPTELFARFAEKFVQSKKYPFEPRPAKEAVELPKSPFLK